MLKVPHLTQYLLSGQNKMGENIKTTKINDVTDANYKKQQNSTKTNQKFGCRGWILNFCAGKEHFIFNKYGRPRQQSTRFTFKTSHNSNDNAKQNKKKLFPLGADDEYEPMQKSNSSAESDQ